MSKNASTPKDKTPKNEYEQDQWREKGFIFVPKPLDAWKQADGQCPRLELKNISIESYTAHYHFPDYLVLS